MSELSKILQGAATHEQIAELLVKISIECGVEFPSDQSGWAHFEIRIVGAISHAKAKAVAVDAYQDAHNNLMRC